VARTAEFDRDVVLQNAMGAFWEDGFEATSMADLLAVTGLSKSSLYATFGGKRELFVEAYDRYRGLRAANLHAILAANPSPGGIRDFFEEIIATGPDGWQRFGCMSTNQAVELGRADPAINARVAADQQLLEDAFTDHLLAGQGAGTVNTEIDARDAASALVAAFGGFQISVRAGMDRSRLSRALAYLLAPLQPNA
jgi:TetR/AcrR family transcriptional repressor of nem operon